MCESLKNQPVGREQTTSAFYRTKNLPSQFENPAWFYAYGSQKDPPSHPFYRTTSLEYGWFAPNVHTVPHSYYPRTTEFSRQQSVGGMYKNYSLNTALDTKFI